MTRMTIRTDNTAVPELEAQVAALADLCQDWQTRALRAEGIAVYWHQKYTETYRRRPSLARRIWGRRSP